MQLNINYNACVIPNLLNGYIHLYWIGPPTFDVYDPIKKLMSYPKCRSVEVINDPAKPGSNHKEVSYIKL
jgi:hypothetical protein